MKDWRILKSNGPAAAVFFAGVIGLATGCVEHRVTYVQPANPAPVVMTEEPAPLMPPPEAPPAPPMVLTPAPPPAPMVPLRSAAELDNMLASIALYPDPLLAQLLPAATLPSQVVLADRYLREGGDPNLIDAQPWDDSLKALARYPATLRMMDDNLAWTTDLGQAFLNQPADVMNSVQRLRAQAMAIGNLQSTPQQSVVVTGGIIEILPANPQIIYVPVYQPEVVYVQPPPAPGRFRISFGVGFMIGAWLNQDCDWHGHQVIVWHPDHPRPADWWSRPPARRTEVVNNVTVINNVSVHQNVTVWQPRPRQPVAASDRGDRGWGEKPAPLAPAKEVRVAEVTREAHPAPTKEVRPAPAPAEVHPGPARSSPAPRAKEIQPPPPRKESGPSPLVKEAQPVPGPAKEVRPAPVRPPVVAPAKPKEAARAPAPRPTPVAPKETHAAPAPGGARAVAAPPAASRVSPPSASPRPVADALAVSESSRAAREASARGQQSREAMAKPAPARPAAAAVPSPKSNAAEPKNSQKTR